MDLLSFSLSEAAELVHAKKASPVDLTRACLDRIERLNAKLNAFITVTAESALAEAKTAESEIQSGHYRGALHGIPIALKDLVDTAGVRTTAASGVFKDRVPAHDAAVVERLKQAGAVLLGKLNLHEFAYGGSGIISYFGAVKNPWNLGHITGGSSSGSAAAVAAGLCYGAIGTDTAGSIRLPAACCGIVGHKPTYGLVSAYGVVPLSWSYDHVGPMTRTVRDAALMLDAIAGYDPRDFCSREFHNWSAGILAGKDRPGQPASNADIDGSLKGLRAGIPRQTLWQELDADVAAAAAEALRVLANLGATVADIEIPADPDRTVSTTESFAYHAQFLPQHSGEYQPATLQRIKTGERYSATDYVLKRNELEAARRQAIALFEKADVFVAPTSAVLPPSFAELEQQPERLRPAELAMLRNTRPFNVLGWPATSVPCGFSKTGLPIGLMIAAAPGRDDVALRVADAFEHATEWHKQRPAL